MSNTNPRWERALWLAAGMLFSPLLMANLPPVIDPIADQSTTAGGIVEVVVVPRDPERVVPGLVARGLPNGASFADNGNGTRTFRWPTSANDVGSHLITFEAIDANDSSLRALSTVAIEIYAASEVVDNGGNGNQTPYVEPLSDKSVGVGELVEFRVVPVDPEGVVPGLRIETLPTGAQFVDNGDGTRQFRWQPASDQLGEHTLEFTAYEESDPALRSSETVSVFVNATQIDNNQERIADESLFFVDLNDQEITLGDTLFLRVVARDRDGSVPGLAIDRLPERAAFYDNGDGTRTFRWQPYPVDVGDTYVEFSAIDADNAALRQNQTIRLRVTRDPNRVVNFPPVINGINNPTIRVGDTLTQLVQPVDPDFTVPSLSALSIPAAAEFVDNGDGTRNFNWTTQVSDLGDTQARFLAVDAVDSSLRFESSITVTVVEPSTFNRSGERLRTLADQRGLKVGYAAVLNAGEVADWQLYGDIAAEEFNIVTPENSHKMGWIQPQRGVFEWEDADAVADFAVEKGMTLHGHPLVWYAQLPGWVQALPPSEASQVMQDHIRALVGRYRGRVAVWDVVNEALEDDGSYRNSIWYQGMGKQYIRDAFVLARAEDPNSALIYNDYDVAWLNPKSDAMYQMVADELAAGTPIDGVGFQMHLASDFVDYESVERNFERFANLGLDIYITEFDVAMFGGPNEQLQADIYKKVMELCLRQTRCKAIQSWGYTDRYSWRAGYQPLMFDDKYIAKPAYYSWQSVLRDYWP